MQGRLTRILASSPRLAFRQVRSESQRVRSNHGTMKNIQIAYLVAAFGVAMFLYQLHQISGLNEEAAVFCAQLNAHNNPGGGTYARAFFDGLTFGAFADEGVFTEAKKSEREGSQLELARVSLISRYENAASYRNWGLIIGIIGIVAVWVLRTKSPNAA